MLCEGSCVNALAASSLRNKVNTPAERGAVSLTVLSRLRRKNDQWHCGGTCVLKDGDMPDMNHRYAMNAAMAKQVSAGWRKAFECC